MSNEIDDTGKQLARWLEEMARRKARLAAVPSDTSRAQAQGKGRLRRITRFKWVLFIAITAALLLIAFALINGHLPPA